MENIKEKTEEELEEIKDSLGKTEEILESLDESLNHEITEEKKHIDFTKGITLGLFYGIIGNLFVQFFYPVIEDIILANYDTLFFANATISFVSLGLIVFVTMQLRKQLKRYEADVKFYRELLEQNQKIMSQVREFRQSTAKKE
jgi:hypothetical protein